MKNRNIRVPLFSPPPSLLTRFTAAADRSEMDSRTLEKSIFLPFPTKKEEKGLRVCYPWRLWLVDGSTNLRARLILSSECEREKTLREWSQKSRRLFPASQQDRVFSEYATKMTEKRKPTSLTSSPTRFDSTLLNLFLVKRCEMAAAAL